MSEESGGSESSGAEAAQEQISTGEANAQEGGNNIPADAQAEIEEALESGDTKEAQKLMKKYELKVRGKTVTREYDLSDDDFMKSQFQLAEVARVEMQNSAELKKAYQKELERFKAKPWEVLKELGFDPDEMAEMRIQQRIEEMKKSPEQLEQEELREELRVARAEAKQNKEEKESIERQKMQEQASVQINDEIGRAISAHKSLPNSPYIVKRVADSMLWAMNNGFEDVTAEDVVPLVEQEMRSEMGQLYDEMPEELLENFIGKKNIDRMRKRRVAQVKAAPSVNDVRQTTLASKAAQDASRPKAAPIRANDFFKNLGKK